MSCQQLMVVVGAVLDNLRQGRLTGNFDEAYRAVTTLQTHLAVFQSLHWGLDSLGEETTTQRNEQRIRNLYKFVYTPPSDSLSQKMRERQQRLRQLDATSLILCSLSYTLGDIDRLAPQVFNCLVENVAEFAGRSTLLRRRDIVRGVMSCLDVDVVSDDPAAVDEFFNSYMVARRSPQQHEIPDNDEPQAGADDWIMSAAGNAHAPAQDEPQAEPAELGPDAGRLSVENITHQCFNGCQEAVGAPQTTPGTLYRYSAAATPSLHVLGDGLTDAIQNSRQWKREEVKWGPDQHRTTDCVSMMIPEDPTQDALVTIWVGQPEGFKLSAALDLVPDFA